MVDGAPEDAAFRSIGNAGCEVEPADSAMVFGIQKAEERRFALCWGRHNAGREDYLRDAAVKWPYLKQEMWWLFGSGTERSGISTGRQGEA